MPESRYLLTFCCQEQLIPVPGRGCGLIQAIAAGPEWLAGQEMETRPCLPGAQVQEWPNHSSWHGFVRFLAVRGSPQKWSWFFVRNESWFPAPSTIPGSPARSMKPVRPGLFFMATKAPSTRISLTLKLSFLWCTEFTHCHLSRQSLVCPRAI